MNFFVFVVNFIRKIIVKSTMDCFISVKYFYQVNSVLSAPGIPDFCFGFDSNNLPFYV